MEPSPSRGQHDRAADAARVRPQEPSGDGVHAHVSGAARSPSREHACSSGSSGYAQQAAARAAAAARGSRAASRGSQSGPPSPRRVVRLLQPVGLSVPQAAASASSTTARPAGACVPFAAPHPMQQAVCQCEEQQPPPVVVTTDGQLSVTLQQQQQQQQQNGQQQNERQQKSGSLDVPGLLPLSLPLSVRKESDVAPGEAAAHLQAPLSPPACLPLASCSSSSSSCSSRRQHVQTCSSSAAHCQQQAQGLSIQDSLPAAAEGGRLLPGGGAGGSAAAGACDPDYEIPQGVLRWCYMHVCC
jgi:hypothetical protein